MDEPMSNLKRRILVVEDEILIADNLCRMLSALGYEAIEPAINYKEVVDCLQSSADELDMVILDVNLNSNQTGLDVAALIREKYHIPFIFLTSYSDTETLEKAKKLFPVGYLVKPVALVDVKVALEMAFLLYDQQANLMPAPNSEALKYSDVLTQTEKVVLSKIADQKTTKEIASELGISPSTVKNHRHNITQKLELPASSHSLLNWVLTHQPAFD